MHPFFHVFGIAIPAYGTVSLLGVIAAVAISLMRVRRAGLSTDDAIILIACGGALGLFGAKVLYFFASVPFAALLAALRNGRWSVLAEGGQVFWGGLVGGFFGVLIGQKITKAKIGPYLRAVIPTIPLAHAFGRVGCFLSGCCYGVPYNGVCAVVYPHAVGGAPSGVFLFPVQLLEAGVNIVLFFLLLYLSGRIKNGLRLALVYLASYSVVRFCLEFLRGDAIRGGFLGLSTSQWISLAVLAAASVAFALGRRGTSRPDMEDAHA